DRPARGAPCGRRCPGHQAPGAGLRRRRPRAGAAGLLAGQGGREVGRPQGARDRGARRPDRRRDRGPGLGPSFPPLCGAGKKAELALPRPARHIRRMFIQTEATPNPEVLKFLPGREVMGEGSRDFRSTEEGQASALAADLFDIEGVERVFFGPDFVTVGKTPHAAWAHLKAPVLAAIMDHFTSGRPLFADESAAGGHDSEVYEGETAQV